MNKPFNWKIFFIVWIAAVVGVIAIIPYSLTLQGASTQDLPIPLPVLLTIQITQNAFMFAVLTAAGLFFANRIGLGLPILEARLRGESVGDKIRAILPLSIVIGVVASLLIVGLDLLVFQPAMLRELGDSANTLNLQTAQPPAWQGFLASFYGGISEEVLLRLFVMSLLAWLGSFISKTTEGRPTSAVFWIANILAAVLFGIGHLPATSMLIPLTPLVITRAIVLNGVAGVAFGWLYWKRGLESAMIAHFSADIVLHVLLAL
ncbi:MAG: CPBP family intramembrane metalloprotease [Anaerolineales bacterium]|nr:CPBP family intramembrane metalloprotease [Anaerolineales bacterium]NUQ83305.1 CPBP family intramembrane metalloprotease [Anaerolineales bacterium]